MDAEGLRDLFRDLGAVRVRRMFGGHGVYGGDVMFALEADGEVYLKADEETRPAFERAGSRPFLYVKNGRPMEMSYWLMPEAGLDDPDEASRWGRLALEAAQRAALRKARSTRRAG
jgi:DNA transformation protein